MKHTRLRHHQGVSRAATPPAPPTKPSANASTRSSKTRIASTRSVSSSASRLKSISALTVIALDETYTAIASANAPRWAPNATSPRASPSPRLTTRSTEPPSPTCRPLREQPRCAELETEEEEQEDDPELRDEVRHLGRAGSGSAPSARSARGGGPRADRRESPRARSGWRRGRARPAARRSPPADRVSSGASHSRPLWSRGFAAARARLAPHAAAVATSANCAEFVRADPLIARRPAP